MAYSYVIAQTQFLNAYDQVKVTDARIVTDFACAGVEDGETNAHSLADAVTEKSMIAGTLEEGRQHADAGKHEQLEFASSSRHFF